MFVFEEIVESGIYRNNNGNPAYDIVKRKIDKRKREVVEQKRNDHRNLYGCFPFAPFARRHYAAFQQGNLTQTCYREFAANNNDGHPCRQLIHLDERDQNSRHKQLVRKRIEKLAKVGYDLVFSGDITIETVGACRYDKDYSRYNLIVCNGVIIAESKRLNIDIDEQKYHNDRH